MSGAVAMTGRQDIRIFWSAGSQRKSHGGYEQELLKAAFVLLSADEHEGVKGREAAMRRELGITD